MNFFDVFHQLSPFSNLPFHDIFFLPPFLLLSKEFALFKLYDHEGELQGATSRLVKSDTPPVAGLGDIGVSERCFTTSP